MLEDERAANETPPPSIAVVAPGDDKQDAAADLFDMLVENGALTPEQMDLLRTQLAAEAQETAKEGPTFSIDEKGLRFRSADGESSMKIGGRLQADAVAHKTPSDLPENLITDGTEVRRARFEMSGTLPSDLSWAAEVDFADDRTAVKDFRVAKDLSENALFSIGHQKQPYSLAIEESSNDLPFTERGLDVYLVGFFVDRAIGIRAQGHTEHVFWAGGVYGDSLNPITVDDESWGVAGRLVSAPIREDDRVLHLGVRGAFRKPSEAFNTIRIRDETAHFSNFSVVDTGIITDVDGVTMYGPEFVFVEGPVSVGGEYNYLDAERTGGNLQFDAWSVFATYSLTGESRAASYRMNEGEFKRLKVADGSRAWELAARLAHIDLNDSDISGGAELASTLGLNWYWSPNIRYMLGWQHVLDTEGGSAETESAVGLDVFTIRTQFTF